MCREKQIEEMAVTTCSLYRGYLDKKCGVIVIATLIVTTLHDVTIFTTQATESKSKECGYSNTNFMARCFVQIARKKHW